MEGITGVFSLFLFSRPASVQPSPSFLSCSVIPTLQTPLRCSCDIIAQDNAAESTTSNGFIKKITYQVCQGSDQRKVRLINESSSMYGLSQAPCSGCGHAPASTAPLCRGQIFFPLLPPALRCTPGVILLQMLLI